MSYDVVKIINTTNYNVSGGVSYMSLFCHDDTYHVTPITTWEAASRGVCLVTKITATVQIPGAYIEATPYTSSGTSYSLFAVIQTGPSSFEVTRRVSGLEDLAPDDYLEPTINQK